MQSIVIGPAALPVAPLLVLAAAWAASWVAGRVAGADAGRAAADAVFHAVIAGLAAARLVHVALAADAYLATPLSIIDLRDGGWHAPAGWAAGLGWLAWRSRVLPGSGRALAAAALAGVLLWAGGGMALGRFERPALPPQLAFAPLGGGAAMPLASHAGGRPMVVNLWATWCGPCRQEMPVLAAAQQREPGVAFVFVNQGEAPAAVQRWLAAQGFVLGGVLLDPASSLGPAVGSRSLPTTLFVDASGRTVDIHAGVLNAASLEARLRALRGG